MEVEFEASLWEWRARRADRWTFVTVPPELSDEIDGRAGACARGFGSLRVQATVGCTVWRTSIFPSAEQKAYILPVKKAVRVSEGLVTDARVRVRLRLLDI